MKSSGKNSTLRGLRIIMDLAMILILLGLIFLLWQIFQFPTPSNNSEKAYLFGLLSQSFFCAISFIITIQIRQIIRTYEKQTFFEFKNVKTIRHISMLLFIYVIVDVVLIQFNPNSNPSEIISKTIGSVTIYETILSILFTINYKMLFLAAIIYLISIVFKEGYNLKEQTNLTI